MSHVYRTEVAEYVSRGVGTAQKSAVSSPGLLLAQMHSHKACCCPVDTNKHSVSVIPAAPYVDHSIASCDGSPGVPELRPGDLCWLKCLMLSCCIHLLLLCLPLTLLLQSPGKDTALCKDSGPADVPSTISSHDGAADTVTQQFYCMLSSLLVTGSLC